MSEQVIKRMDDFRHQLHWWMTAYPLRAFPEPDLKRAAEVLKAHGMTLDSISASNMRHVVQQIAPVADSLLGVATMRIRQLEAGTAECEASQSGGSEASASPKHHSSSGEAA